jgi:tetratricopeptide (TPR) repeat protein
MPRFLMITLIVLFTCTLFAQDNPISDYFTNPGTHSFRTAYNFCADKLAEDSTQLSYRILMANLAVMEADRLTDSVYTVKDSLDAGGKFQFANLLLSQNRFEEAIGFYDGLNADSPGWSCPWRHKGQALYSLKRYKEAEASLQKAIETNLEHYDAYIWMAKTQYQLKKYKPALKNLETALTLNPEAEESTDIVMSDKDLNAFHIELLKKCGKLIMN